MRLRASFLCLVLFTACSTPASTDDAGVDTGVCTPERCPPDPCASIECPDARHDCVIEGGMASCRCPAGTHAEGDRCVDDVSCTETTCGLGGTCREEDGALVCSCAPGYTGERCESCAEGYLRDREGRCDADLCDPSPCMDPDRARCVIEDGAAVCRCKAGTHEEGGACVPDVACMPDTCLGRGTCSETSEGVACECFPGFAGRFCDACAEGFHPDGAGGCTDDACVPDPCAAPFSRCVAADVGAVCECPFGSHRVGDTCAPDEVCTDATCGGRGACTVVEGLARCACEPAYVGDRCETCAPGFHDDGAGGCTNDVCVPNPCTAPNRGVCSAGPSGAVCACDPGYHEDGVGGCTDDPCLPHPCGTQACRVSASGDAECYTPMCDDGNPCTTDTPTASGCVYAPRPNGSACSTSACIGGQTCNAGSCGGGTPVVCDDGNACTVDACDAITGCSFTPSTALVPDDGIACTIDRCTASGPTHTPSDAACDDGLYCTGVERCAPTDAGRDARGCVRTSVPVPPAGSTPCASYGACDEAIRGFPLVARAAGSACDDGIACTTSDVCLTSGGACAGTVTGSCSASGTCTSTVPWSSVIDVPSAAVTGAITIDGAAPPTTVSSAGYGTSIVWAVARDTGVRHELGRLSYTTTVTGGYRLSSGDGTIDVRLIPGVYDILYQRDVNTSTSGSGDRWVNPSRTAVPLPSGWRIVRENVVLGPGTGTLNVDVPSAAVTGTITIDGAAPPSMVSSAGYGTSIVWAVSRDTGVRHELGRLSYTTTVTGGYRLSSGDGAIDARLIPGTYDILYQRDVNTSTSGSGDRWVNPSRTAVPLPSGWRLVRSGVVITAGASTLDVDVPSAAVTGTITIDGAAPPSMVSGAGYGTSIVWAVSRDTGVRHELGRLSYTTTVTGGYRLSSGDGTIDVRLIPGVYDILYQRDVNTSSSGSGDRWVSPSRTAVPLPSGWRLVREGVVIAAGASTLDVDVPSAAVTGTITLDGAPPPSMVSSAGYGTSIVWAVSRDTGVRHELGRWSYTTTVTGGYRLSSGDGTIDVRLIPGVYDILYQRDVNTSSSGSGDRWVNPSRTAVPLPSGWRLVRSGVVIAAGASTLDVDVPSAAVTGTIRIDGAAPPSMVSSAGYGTSIVWAVSRDTGVRHELGRLSYTTTVTGGYRLSSGDGTIDVRLIPGTYDILYQRDVNTSTSGSGDRWVNPNRTAVPLPSGWRIVREGVVIAAGAGTLNVDVPSAALLGSITLDGAPPPSTVSSAGYGTSIVWAVSRDTGVRHELGRWSYTTTVTGGYRLSSGDGTIDVRLIPGTYDILYQRDVNTSTSGSGDRWVNPSRTAVPLPSGWRYLRQCVLVP